MELWIDTNVIIRFLANEHPEHSPIAKQIFTDAYNGRHTLWIHHLIIAECCYVLEGSYYGYNRYAIADSLLALLSSKGIRPESPSIIGALELYSQYSIDFEDAYLAFHASTHKARAIVSFNIKDFVKSGCECYHPSMLLKNNEVDS